LDCCLFIVSRTMDWDAAVWIGDVGELDSLLQEISQTKGYLNGYNLFILYALSYDKNRESLSKEAAYTCSTLSSSNVRGDSDHTINFTSVFIFLSDQYFKVSCESYQWIASWLVTLEHLFY